jgi:NAD(P)-dependent dehydrogenase (short-subunit alcohol dehydrogenase family)
VEAIVDGRFSVAGQVVLVTGASLGIGRAIALGFARAGAHVAVNFRTHADEAATLVAQIADEGVGRAVAVAGDVADPVAVNAMVERVQETLGPVDCLVSNAGINVRRPALELDVGEWHRVLAVHLDGTFLCARAVVQQCMAARQRGTIITIASISAFTGHRGVVQSAYHAAKGGLVMLTRSLALEWVDHGIRVNTLCPGFVSTPLLADDFAPGSEAYDTAVEAIPMGRFATPEELVGPAIFLASDASSYMTGQALVVDGGYLSL